MRSAKADPGRAECRARLHELSRAACNVAVVIDASCDAEQGAAPVQGVKGELARQFLGTRCKRGSTPGVEAAVAARSAPR